MARYAVQPTDRKNEATVLLPGRGGALVFTGFFYKRCLRLHLGQWDGEHDKFIRRFNQRRVPIGFNFTLHIETEE